MPFRNALPVIVSTLLAFALVSPATAGGEVVITQAKALAGNVTPGDTPGYPVTLSQPGAYMLESNLTVTPGTYGLFVTANNVDIDMNGFTLSGNGGGTYGLISGFGESSIHGGVINRFRNSGIYLRNNTWTIEDMKIVRNGGTGVDATEARSITVKDSSILSNGGTGVRAGADGRIETSNVSRNGGEGVVCRAGCYVANNTLNGNSGYGLYVAEDGGIVVGNLIVNNGSYGLYTQNQGPGRTARVGYGNNTLTGNSLGDTSGATPLIPNFCSPLPC